MPSSRPTVRCWARRRRRSRCCPAPCASRLRADARTRRSNRRPRGGSRLPYGRYLWGVMTCPSCASDVPAGASFCPTCGTPLVQRADERRVVTILFADVVGFTGLSESRDPEGVKYLLDRCFERLAADVTSHGGRLDKIVGAELMAVFGAPVAHED